MAAIQDIVVRVSSAIALAARQAFGIPVLVGFTGQRSILSKGSGASGIVYKSVVRNDTVITVAVSVGTAFTYAVLSKAITIEIPSATTTVREFIADFLANAPTAVTDLISVERVSTGSGVMPTHTAEALTYTEFLDIRDISQLQYYYDSTDVEYIVIGNYLSSRPTPGRLYLFDAFSSTDIPGDLAGYDNGSWYLVITTAIDSTNQQILADYVNIRTRAATFVSNDVAVLDTVQGSRVMYIIHDAPNDHPEISHAAFKLPAQPGSTTWKFAGPLSGQTPNATATLTDLLNVRTNRGQSYVQASEGATPYVDGGRMNDPGQIIFMDQVRGRDWIELNLQADLIEFLQSASARNEKIPYTNAGIEAILSVVERRLTLAGTFGIIAPVETAAQAELSRDGRYQFNITAPTVEQIKIDNPSDIVNRVLNDIVFQFVEAGAIEGMDPVTGRVVLEL